MDARERAFVRPRRGAKRAGNARRLDRSRWADPTNLAAARRYCFVRRGEAGLRALEDCSFDLMIVDIFMPHMRGFASIRIFHERAPSIPLVAMSGYAFANPDSPAPDFLRLALELGAACCRRKPFMPGALMAVVNGCLVEARLRFTGVVQSS